MRNREDHFGGLRRVIPQWTKGRHAVRAHRAGVLLRQSHITILSAFEGKKLMEPKKSDLPRRAQRKFEIKQEDKLLFSALLCALVK